MVKIVLFVLLSIPLVSVSWRSLSHWKNHGLYRFLAWEGILWLLLQNITFWFRDPLSPRQVVSWIFLVYSGYLIIAGVVAMNKAGKRDEGRDKSLYDFEKTRALVTSGVFRHIRHPMYASLLFLAWGTYLKRPDPGLLTIALASTFMLIMTVYMEEVENISYFGKIYSDYMERSKRFLPFIY